MNEEHWSDKFYLLLIKNFLKQKKSQLYINNL